MPYMGVFIFIYVYIHCTCRSISVNDSFLVLQSSEGNILVPGNMAVSILIASALYPMKWTPERIPTITYPHPKATKILLAPLWALWYGHSIRRLSQGLCTSIGEICGSAEVPVVASELRSLKEQGDEVGAVGNVQGEKCNVKISKGYKRLKFYPVRLN